MQKHTFLCLIVWTMTKLVLIRAFQLEVCSPEQQVIDSITFRFLKQKAFIENDPPCHE